MKYLSIIRKIVQLSALAFFCCLPFLASLGFSGISGSLFSLDFFGIPFADPASAAQVAGQSAWLGKMPSLMIFAGAGLSLLLAFFLGRVFCGWLCPYGLFAEFAARGKKVWKHGRRMRVIILVSTLLLASLIGYPIITWLSMPGQITLAPLVLRGEDGLALLVLLVPFLALIIDLLLGRRFFCSSICPQATLLSGAASLLPGRFPGLRIKWQREHCACRGAPCEKACQFTLTPRRNLDRGECVMCGECVSICARNGRALKFAFRNRSHQGPRN